MEKKPSSSKAQNVKNEKSEKHSANSVKLEIEKKKDPSIPHFSKA